MKLDKLSAAVVALVLGLILHCQNPASAQIWTGGGANSNWDAYTSFLGLRSYTNWGSSPVLPQPGSQVVFGSGFASGNPNLNGNRSVGSVVISTNANINITGGQFGITGGALLVNSSEGTQTFQTPILFGAPGLITMNRSPYAGALVLSGGILGGSLNITGTGIVRLTAPSGYTGPTTINGPIVSAENLAGSATGPGDVIISNGGQLHGYGTVFGMVTVNAGAALGPGVDKTTTTGTLTFKNGLDLKAGSILRMDLGGASDDLIRITGGHLSAEAHVLVQISNYGTLGPNQEYTIVDFNGATADEGIEDRFRLIGGTGAVKRVGDTLVLDIDQYPVIYVNDTAPGDSSGSSWHDAYRDLQDALSEADPGTLVFVAEGTYNPAETIEEDRTKQSFKLKNGVRVYGGFPESGSPGPADRNPFLHKTILTGDLGNGQRSFHVVDGSNTNSTAVLDGFVIQDGVAYGIPATGENRGANVYIVNGSPTIANCQILNGAALVGGGAYLSGSQALFINCVFFRNTALVGGASGGAMYITTSSPTISNSTFVENEAANGGGIYLGGSPQTTVRNSIFWDNPGGNIWGTASVRYSCVQGGYGGTGNIAGNPQFLDQPNGDLRLNPVSPCAEAGSNSSLPLDLADTDIDADTAETVPLDLEMKARILGVTVDMGPFEVTDPQPALSAPTGLEATAVSSSEISLDWSDNPEPGVAGYHVYRSTEPGFSAGLTTRVAEAVATSSYSDTGLNNGVTYYYLVTAVNASNGESETSGEASATTDPIAEVIYVDDDAADGGDGSSWNSAFNDLQDALARAGLQDQIWVASGTYFPAEPVGFYDPFAVGISFQLKSGVQLFGGFNGSPGTEGDFTARDIVNNRSILSGDMGDNNISKHVVGSTGADETAVLDGFEITGGFAGGPVQSLDNAGAGLRVLSGGPTISNCLFQGNRALVGGAVYNGPGTTTRIVRCVFRENEAASGGAAGGAMYNTGSNVLVVNSLFVDNLAEEGGAIYNTQGGNPQIINSTLYSNTATFRGGGIWNGFAGQGTVRNSILWSNTAAFAGQIGVSDTSAISVEYSTVQDGYAGTGNISSNPLFMNAGGDDFRLQPVSPAIDAGRDAAVPAGITIDLPGYPRFVGAAVDMGAVEYIPAAQSIAISKLLGDGSPVAVSGVVTRQFDQATYIEAEDRSAGIRIEGASVAAGEGSRVEYLGVIHTNDNGERYVSVTQTTILGKGEPLAPLVMANKTLGGSDWNFNGLTGAGQAGIEGGLGLNNVGLLVTTSGLAFHSDPGLMVDDGSGVVFEFGIKGIRLLPEGNSIAPSGHIKVTGISTLVRNKAGEIRPAIRLLGTDIEDINPQP